MAVLYKICFLGYRNLSGLAKSALSALDLPDAEIRIVDCNVENLHETVESALRDGFEIFIAGSANAAEFRRRFHAKLVEINLRPVDYLVAVKKALNLGKKPVIAMYRYGRPVNIPLLEELSGISLRTITYEDSADLLEGILSTDGDVIIGGSHACELAEANGIKCILLYPGEDTVRSAIRRSYTLAQQLSREMRQTRVIQSILANAPVGLIVTDSNGNITLFNTFARRFTQIGDMHVQGKLLSDILPELSPDRFLLSGEQELSVRRQIKDTYLRCVQVRIQGGDINLGVLTTLYPDNARKKKAEIPSDFLVSLTWKDAVGSSTAFTTAIREAKKYSSSDYPLLITGEPGCGRDFFSQCIHTGSARAKAPYIPVNLSLIPDQEAARILFGYEHEGIVKPGLLETAGQGTLVLRHLELATPVLQQCILQVLNEKKFLRLGGLVPIPFEARTIAILDEGRGHSGILPELFNALSVLMLRIPPLRERENDILLLGDIYFAHEMGNAVKKAMLKNNAELLCYYSWPGNLTELTAVCRRYTFFNAEKVKATAAERHLMLVQAIGEENLFAEILRKHPALSDITNSPAREFLAGLNDIKHILKYNNSVIAEKLGISRTTLWRLSREDSEKL